MKTFRFIALLLALPFLTINAKTYKLEGMVGGKYPIVMELEEDDNGFLSGKYAYKSTLQKNGDFTCSWLNINPDYKNGAMILYVFDCKSKQVETWHDIRFTDRKHLTAKMKNAKGLTYDISANVTQSSEVSPGWIAHFKSHLGEYASDFYMFFDPSIQDRWGTLMGEQNFDYLTNIYQTQTPIEYRNGMFWASGFVAHQCCDPVTIWAYDTANDKFYIWIRKDGRDYWWSETGTIPYHFRELVNSQY